MPAGPLINYGYDGEVLLLVTLAPQRSLAIGDKAVLRARADWLVCKELCIPEGADLELALPIDKASADDPRWGMPIAAARAALPRPLTGWQASAQGKGAIIVMKLVPPALNFKQTVWIHQIKTIVILETTKEAALDAALLLAAQNQNLIRRS